jgi:hypothetical protein
VQISWQGETSRSTSFQNQIAQHAHPSSFHVIFAVPMATHDELWKIVKKLPSDFEPYGQRNRDTDEPSEGCSSGCIHFAKLEGKLGYDGAYARTQKVRARPCSRSSTWAAPEFEAEKDTALS